MAKLQATKEKYGVPVSGRINTEMAAEIADRAEALGVSMAKMVSILIAKGFHPKAPTILDNREDVEAIDLKYRTQIATFIKKISNHNEQRERELIELFKSISNPVD